MPETKEWKKPLGQKGNFKLHLNLAARGQILSPFSKPANLKELIGGPPESVALCQHLL